MALEVSVEQLGPGEIVCTGESADGAKGYVRRLDDGRLEAGRCWELDKGPRHDEQGMFEVGDPVRAGVRRVTSELRYTARGPRQVASPSYRAGWDAIFGGKGGSALS